MGPVEVEISMSVDGFITGPNEEGAGLVKEARYSTPGFGRIQTARASSTTRCSAPREP
jgi:hypothetical protein